MIASKAGSSPLARGLLSPAPHLDVSLVDHPRSRGVYEHYPSADMADYGSSPLARGLPNMGQQQHVRNRIIPARAGFTAEYQRKVQTQEDHPRSRGVYVINVFSERG